MTLFRRARLLGGALPLFVFALLLLWAGGVADAHQLQVEPVAILLRPQQSYINAEFSGNVQDITQIPDAMVEDSERIGDTFSESARDRIEAYINESFRLTQGEALLAGELRSLRYEANLDPTKSRFFLVMRYPREGTDVDAPLRVGTRLFDYLPNARTLVTLGGFSRAMSPGDTAEIDPENLAANLLTNVGQFFVLGAEHIFLGPDHLLFILGLLLVAADLKTLVKTLTGFTLAHSVTLVLATLGVVTPGARLVEVVVALSIIYVGAENLFARSFRHRFWIASAFGLVHGFAFAQNLREAGLPEGNALFWSLLSFNVGVEAAQVIVCAAAFPLLMLWKRGVDRRAKNGGMPWDSVVKLASCAVIAGGGKWLFETLLSGG